MPDHCTFARFRTGRCRDALEDLFYQLVQRLEDIGETDHTAVFIDGTKLESCAGRYTFVWRKSVEKAADQGEGRDPPGDGSDLPVGLAGLSG